MDNLTPQDVIECINKSSNYMKTIFTRGGCYKFHTLLSSFFKDATPLINLDKDHVVTLIGDIKYDINGVVDGVYFELTECDLKEVGGWSFERSHFLSVGECKHCEEPILAET